jgi:hypothetical protein
MRGGGGRHQPGSPHSRRREQEGLVERARRAHHRLRLGGVAAVVAAEVLRPDREGQRSRAPSPAALHASPDIGKDVTNRIQVSGAHVRCQLCQDRLERRVVQMEQGQDVQFVCRSTD